MRIGRYRVGDGAPAWAVIDAKSDAVTPIRGAIGQWAPTARLGQLPEGALDESATTALSSVTLLAPLEPTAKVLCVGLNYRSHVQAFPGATMPEAPLAFIKANTAVVAHEDPMVYPALTSKFDYEIELVVIVAGPVREGAPIEDSILGYTVGNDATARDLQRGPRGYDLYSSKSLDDTSGVGPWITTIDEIGDAPDLQMQLSVNGDVRQVDRTSGMQWSVGELMRYVNARTRILAGDLLFTGTPAGVGSEDGRYLQIGDVVEASIERIGVLRNTVGARAWP